MKQNLTPHGLSQGAKEQVLKTALSDGEENRCQQEYERWREQVEVPGFWRIEEGAEMGWQAAWKFLQREYEAYVKS